jgi:hypothetical protein
VTPEDDLLADVEFDLIDESDPPPRDVFARDTAIPASPPEELAAEAMRQAETGPANPLEGIDDDRLPTPPPMRARHLTPATLEPPPSEDLEFDSFDAPIDVFGHPLPGTSNQERVGFGQSQAPTAPPIARPPVPSVGKRTPPVRNRADRPAFLAETTRNRPPDPETLAQATPSSRQNPARVPGLEAFDESRSSALDFVDSLDPVMHSVSPRAGRNAGSPPPSAPASSTRLGVQELEECYAVGDYSRALQIAEQLLARSPDDLAARRYAQNCRDVLTQMFAARIGPLDQVISVVVSPEEVQWLSLDHRAGFLLSLVDGQSTVDEILDISGMTRLDALKILHDLAEQQVVRLA